MIEAAIVLPALILVLLVFVELSQILIVQELVVAAAKEGLNQAVKIPNIEKGAANADFLAAEKIVIDAAKALPIKTMMSDGAGGNWASVLNVVLIRPGQGAGTIINQHPLAACRPLPAGSSVAELMVVCPIGVRLVTEVNLLFPFSTPFQVRGEAFGFREVAFTDQDVPEVVR